MIDLPGPKLIIFHGVYNAKRRYLIEIDGIHFYVQKKHFRYLFILAIARIRSDRKLTGGWVKKTKLDKLAILNSRVYELRKQVAEQLGDRVWMFPLEDNNSGKMRLNISENCNVQYDSECLLMFPDQYVQDLTRELEEASIVEANKNK